MAATATAFVVQYANRPLVLRLVEDPERLSRALAHGLGQGLAYDLAQLDGPAREPVLALGRAWAEEPPSSTHLAAVARLRELVGLHLPEATVRVARRHDAAQPMPPWPLALRRGAPSGDAFWPFDPELASLRAGRRAIIKRESESHEAAERDAAWLRSAGCELASLPGAPGRPPVLFASLSRAQLGDALEAERALAARGPAHEEAVVWLGSALGYPRCCVDAFHTISRRDDVSLATAFLPSIEDGPHAATSLWLTAPLALVSHTPCSLDCEATIDLGAGILARLDAELPGFAVRWRAMAERVHVIDRAGRTLLLEVEDTADGALRVRHADELSPAGRLEPRDTFVGALLRADAGGLRREHDDWHAALAADHRGRAR